jgi:hypothetical protein
MDTARTVSLAVEEKPVRLADATTDPVKLTVNVSREAYNALKAMAAQRGVTLTEMLRQAISTAKWVQETTAQGEKILKQDRAGHLFEVVFR